MRRFLIFVTAACVTSSAFATEWVVLGPRAMAMGGAGVALPNGGESAYWNPAGLGEADNPSGLQVPIGAHLGLTGTVLQGANDLNQVNKDCSNGSAGCTQANITNALSELNNPNDGLRADVGGGVDLKFGRLGLFVNNFTYVAAKPIIDMTNDTPATIQNNTSGLALRGISVTEIGAAYGHEIPFMPGIFAGVALKGEEGRVGFDDFGVVNNDANSNGGLSNFTKNSQQSFQPAIDAAALWDLGRTFSNVWWRPRVGLTAHDLNDPKFKNPSAAIADGAPDKYSLQSNARMGVSLTPLSFWNIAADADLTRNLTALEGVESQNIALGTEINVFNRSWINIPLRAGISKNIALAGTKTALSGGFGLNFLHFNVDLGANVTPSNQTIQSQGSTKKLPSEVSAGGQIAFLFGGGPAALRAQEKASGAGVPVQQ